MVLCPANTAEITLLNNVDRCSTIKKCREIITTVFYQNTGQGEFTACYERHRMMAHQKLRGEEKKSLGKQYMH